MPNRRSSARRRRLHGWRASRARAAASTPFGMWRTLIGSSFQVSMTSRRRACEGTTTVVAPDRASRRIQTRRASCLDGFLRTEPVDHVQMRTDRAKAVGQRPFDRAPVVGEQQIGPLFAQRPAKGGKIAPAEPAPLAGLGRAPPKTHARPYQILRPPAPSRLITTCSSSGPRAFASVAKRIWAPPTANVGSTCISFSSLGIWGVTATSDRNRSSGAGSILHVPDALAAWLGCQSDRLRIDLNSRI